MATPFPPSEQQDEVAPASSLRGHLLQSAAGHPPSPVPLGLASWTAGREMGRGLDDQTNGLLCKFASAYVGRPDKKLRPRDVKTPGPVSLPLSRAKIELGMQFPDEAARTTCPLPAPSSPRCAQL